MVCISNWPAQISLITFEHSNYSVKPENHYLICHSIIQQCKPIKFTTWENATNVSMFRYKTSDEKAHDAANNECNLNLFAVLYKIKCKISGSAK